MPDEPPTSANVGRAAASDTNCLPSPDELSILVGANLRRLRRRQGHSLERLAPLSGVSRAMLAQIETGKSAPTVNLLRKVANALTVPFAQLVAAPDGEGAVVLRRERAKILSSSGGNFTSRALFPFDAGRQVRVSISFALPLCTGRWPTRIRRGPGRTLSWRKARSKSRPARRLRSSGRRATRCYSRPTRHTATRISPMQRPSCIW